MSGYAVHLLKVNSHQPTNQNWEFFPVCSFGFCWLTSERISASLHTPPTSTWSWATKLRYWRNRLTHSAWRWRQQGLDLLWWVNAAHSNIPSNRCSTVCSVLVEVCKLLSFLCQITCCKQFSQAYWQPYTLKTIYLWWVNNGRQYCDYSIFQAPLFSASLNCCFYISCLCIDVIFLQILSSHCEVSNQFLLPPLWLMCLSSMSF